MVVIPKRAPVRVNPVLIHPWELRTKLDGEWEFKLDPQDTGLAEQWFSTFADSDLLVVPGCWQGQGYGDDRREKIWAFEIEERIYQATYAGVGWYAKRFILPHSLMGKRVWLNFGGVHPSGEVWLNGVKLGEHHEPFVPFGFEVTDQIVLEGMNLLVVRVHEQERVMGMAYNWQGHWSGLYRGVELTATGACGLAQLLLYPQVDAQRLTVVVDVDGMREACALSLRMRVTGANCVDEPRECDMNLSQASTTFSIDMPNPRLWSPDTPNLYRVDAVLLDDGMVVDALSERTGFVKLSTAGKHFLINDAPYYMRGTGEFLPCPETGCPDTDREHWRKRLSALRAYGYNYVRCQSYAQIPEYLDVADEVGMLVQNEMGMLESWDGGHAKWNEGRWPKPNPDFRQKIARQWDHTVLRDVHHPSANIYCMSNECVDTTMYKRTALRCYQQTKRMKPSAFVILSDGGIYNAEMPTDFLNDEAEIDALVALPVIQHEWRWWSSYPDVRLREQYNGAVRPYAIDIAIATARQQGVEHLLPAMAANSQVLQYIEAKGKMEMCRRDNPTLAGICHFNAVDLNPSPQGIIDEFFEQKYADSRTWQQTNGDTVILSSLNFIDRVYAEGDAFTAGLFVSDFSHPALKHPHMTWQVTCGDAVMHQGTVAYHHMPYRTCEVGEVAFTVGEIAKPIKAVFSATVTDGERQFSNHWDLWFFPTMRTTLDTYVYSTPEHTWLSTLDTTATRPVAGQVIFTEQITEDLIAFMQRGGRVLLAASEGLVRPYPTAYLVYFPEGKYFFTPPANYPPYEYGQNGTIIAQHPLFHDFPHEGFADLHCYRLMCTPPIDIESITPTADDPIIRVIHRYHVNRHLAHLVEYGYGKGGLIISSLDLNQQFPEARYLLTKICRYLGGTDFHPQTQLTPAEIQFILMNTMW